MFLPILQFFLYNHTGPHWKTRNLPIRYSVDQIFRLLAFSRILMSASKKGTFDLFPGNESEKLHMRPVINRVKNEFSDGRIIFVADRGLNTSDNIYYLTGDNKGDINIRDGYVYGQSVRGAHAEFKS